MSNQNTKITKELDSRITEIKSLLLEGYSVSEISKRIGFGYASVYNAIQRNGLSNLISVKNNGKSKTSKKYHEDKSLFDKSTLLREYVDNKLNLYEIAEKYKTSAANVLLYMRKYDIKTRTKSEATKLLYEKHGDILREKHRQNAYNGITGIHRKGHSRTETWIEKIFEKYCIDNNIKYEKQYQINCKGHRYDFLIYDNLLIELDGNFWHNTEKQKKLDESHNLLAKENGYDIIRFTDSEIKKTKGSCFEKIREYDNGRTNCL